MAVKMVAGRFFKLETYSDTRAGVLLFDGPQTAPATPVSWTDFFGYHGKSAMFSAALRCFRSGWRKSGGMEKHQRKASCGVDLLGGTGIQVAAPLESSSPCELNFWKSLYFRRRGWRSKSPPSLSVAGLSIPASLRKRSTPNVWRTAQWTFHGLIRAIWGE